MSSGLNNALWDPHFDLSKFRTVLRATEEGNYTEIRYIGEMFQNFMLIKEVRTYCGVEISNDCTE